MDKVRLFLDITRSGVENMAIDEAILTVVGQGLAEPTIRFYGWSEPTISLGHFQRHSELDDLAEHFRGLAVVRRITGGGAILHDAELTYSLILPGRHRLVLNKSPAVLYVAVHQALVGALAQLGIAAQLRQGAKPGSQQRGPFFCFERINPSDVIVNGKKIAGSAQRRTGKSLLQHGSLMLDNPLQQPGLATVADFELAGRADVDLIGRLWAEQLAVALQLELVEGQLNEAEMGLMESLRAKYGSEAWTRERRRQKEIQKEL